MITPAGKRRDRAAEGRDGGGRDAASRPRRARCARRRASRPTVREPLGDVRYTYRRGGRRVRKTVHFYLCEYVSGSTERPRSRGRRRPLDRRSRARATALSYPGERALIERVLSKIAVRSLVCPRRAGPQLLLHGLRRPDEARPQDRDHPAGRQAAQVPQEPGRAGHRRLPVLAAREAVPRGDRQRRGQAGQGPLTARHRARQPRVPPHGGARALPRADLRARGRRSRTR